MSLCRDFFLTGSFQEKKISFYIAFKTRLKTPHYKVLILKNNSKKLCNWIRMRSGLLQIT